MRLPEGTAFEHQLNEQGLSEHVQLDMGQIISVTPRPLYPNDRWDESYNNQNPMKSGNELLIEYTAHPEACFHIPEEQRIPVQSLDDGGAALADR